MLQKIINRYQCCVNVVSNHSLFFMSIGMHIVKRYILLTFVAVLAAKIRLNSNVFISDQFGEAYAFFWEDVIYFALSQYFIHTGRYLTRSKFIVPSSNSFLSLSIVVRTSCRSDDLSTLKT